MNEKELIYTLPTGDPVYRYQEAVVVMFGGKRKVLSTGGGNGGYTEHLQSVFNHQSGYGYCTNPEDAPVTYEEYITDFVNNKLGLPLETTTGMATIVSMENVCIEEASYKDLSVTAIATASDFELTYAGKHGKLGEMIGITVKAAVKKALGKHMGLTPESQHSIEKRTFRYGLTQEKYWEACAKEHEDLKVPVTEQIFKSNLDSLDKDSCMVAYTSLYIHLMDQLDWGLLESEEVDGPASLLLAAMAEHAGVSYCWSPLEKCQRPQAIEELAARFRAFMIQAGASKFETKNVGYKDEKRK